MAYCFTGKIEGCKKCKCSGIPISRTSRGNANWFEKSRGKITVLHWEEGTTFGSSSGGSKK